MKIRRGFSLIELSICVVIIFILASTIAVNINSYEQTAKQEAEKLEAYIHDLMRKADRSHQAFELNLESNMIRWQWSNNKTTWKNATDGILIYKKNPTDKEKPIISPGFTVNHNFKNDILTYQTTKQFSNNGHFTITRDDDTTKYYVYIRLGRVRLAEKEYPDE